MVYQVWVCFDENGDPESICFEPSCEGKECHEYLMKLIPVNRTKEKINDLQDISKEVERSTRQTLNEVSKLEKSIRKFKIK